MEKDQKERLRNITIIGLGVALGTAALKKDFLNDKRVLTFRYLEASKAVWIERIEHGTMKATKLVALALRKEDGTPDFDSIVISEEVELTERQITELEVDLADIPQTNPLQNG